MHPSLRVLIILVFLSCAANASSSFHQASARQSKIPLSLSVARQRNLSMMPDPWVYSTFRTAILPSEVTDVCR